MSAVSIAYYRAADITVAVQADLPLRSETFTEKLSPFQVTEPGADTITLHHHFAIPDDRPKPEEGTVVMQHHARTVFWTGDTWVYDSADRRSAPPLPQMHARWTADYAHGHIYHAHARRWLGGQLDTLTLMATDQVLFARVLADRHGALIHSAGMDLWGEGFLFLGHSGAGKSTTVSMLREHGTVLCDDRVALRYSQSGFRIYGTWCQNIGTVPDLSPASAPLRALCFLEQADTNQAILLTDRQEILRRLLPRLVKPLITHDWWEKTLATVEQLVCTVPAYRLLLDRSGRVAEVLQHL